MSDAYQKRYLAHRERKAEMIAANPESLPKLPAASAEGLLDVLVLAFDRRSVRRFYDLPLPKHLIEAICKVVRQAPQSCNRQALKLKIVPGNSVNDLLAGGEGWLGHAPTVILIFADMAAYKSPIERDFMPWLDAGVAMATITYAATAACLASCIINPHVRPGNVDAFNAAFNKEDRLFCGAVALGYPLTIPEMPEKKPMEELVEW